MNLSPDVLTSGSSLLLSVLALIFFAYQWFTASEEKKRQWIEDLVRRAEQTMQGADGAAKLDYVLNETKSRFPGFPVDVARTLIEAAVNRIKAEKPQVIEVFSGELIDSGK